MAAGSAWKLCSKSARQGTFKVIFTVKFKVKFKVQPSGPAGMYPRAKPALQATGPRAATWTM
jgi:hypothetical protein